MRDVLLDVLRHIPPGITEFRVIGTSAKTTISGSPPDRLFHFEGEFKAPQPELEGTFGITNIKLLSGLLNFPAYRADGATLTAKRRIFKDGKPSTVEQFEFRDAKGTGANFRCMNPDLLGSLPEIRNVPWDISFKPDPAKHAEFSQLAGLYSDVDKLFSTRTKDNTLIFGLGDESSSSTHNATMVYAEGMTAELRGELLWRTDQFLTITKLAPDNERQIKLTNRKVLGIEIDSPQALYKYYLRSAER
jgi:hypothetical protein